MLSFDRLFQKHCATRTSSRSSTRLAISEEMMQKWGCPWEHLSRSMVKLARSRVNLKIMTVPSEPSSVENEAKHEKSDGDRTRQEKLWWRNLEEFTHEN